MPDIALQALITGASGLMGGIVIRTLVEVSSAYGGAVTRWILVGYSVATLW
jgi:hypothetical protein